MARQTSKGICAFCQKTVSKSGIARHLATCEQRAARHIASAGQLTPAFHLQVQGKYLPMYWLHLAVSADSPLSALDNFLRDIWLECCGHLSQFIIDDVRYRVDVSEKTYYWGRPPKNMKVPLNAVLRPAQTCSYEYDFGSTTELLIKVLAEQTLDLQGRNIQVLARNTFLCDVCGATATHECTRCQDQYMFCDICVKNHSCPKKAIVPVVNSPRAGVCGYGPFVESASDDWS